MSGSTKFGIFARQLYAGIDTMVQHLIKFVVFHIVHEAGIGTDLCHVCVRQLCTVIRTHVAVLKFTCLVRLRFLLCEFYVIYIYIGHQSRYKSGVFPLSSIPVPLFLPSPSHPFPFHSLFIPLPFFHFPPFSPYPFPFSPP